MADDESEFGRGVVVCLAKFAEHLMNDQAIQIWKAKNEPESLREDIWGTKEAALSHRIEMWMNGASDHFYELDRDRSPQPLRELAELALRIGHGFTGETWTMEHVDRIRELWKESCLAVDRMLGIEKPEWGRW